MGLNFSGAYTVPIRLKATQEAILSLKFATRCFFQSSAAQVIPKHNFTKNAETALIGHLKNFLLSYEPPPPEVSLGPAQFYRSAIARVSLIIR